MDFLILPPKEDSLKIDERKLKSSVTGLKEGYCISTRDPTVILALQMSKQPAFLPTYRSNSCLRHDLCKGSNNNGSTQQAKFMCFFCL